MGCFASLNKRNNMGLSVITFAVITEILLIASHGCSSEHRSVRMINIKGQKRVGRAKKHFLRMRPQSVSSQSDKWDRGRKFGTPASLQREVALLRSLQEWCESSGWYFAGTACKCVFHETKIRTMTRTPPNQWGFTTLLIKRNIAVINLH